MPSQPLAGSWQERVKAAKRAEKRAAKKAAKAPAGGTDLAALSKGLPTGWQAMIELASGDVYYGNLSTKVGDIMLVYNVVSAYLALRQARRLQQSGLNQLLMSARYSSSMPACLCTSGLLLCSMSSA